tara:strand:- start:889 stop:1656 length:768 start_codon:yes stop_codon:yes gene_type:complete
MPSPKSIADIKSNLLAPATTSHFEVEIPIIDALSQWRNESGGQSKINLMCSDASLPGSNLATLETNSDRTGVTEKFAYRRIFDDRIDLTFYVEVGGYSPIKFFEQWMDYITGASTTRDFVTADDNRNELIDKNYFYRMRYPNDYIADQGLKITKFEKDYTGNVLEYEFVRSFPLSISSMPVSYDGSSLLKCSVSMSYIRYVVKNLHKKPSLLSNPSEQASRNGGFLSNLAGDLVDSGFSNLGGNDLLRSIQSGLA